MQSNTASLRYPQQSALGIDSLLLHRLALRHVEPPVVDRAAAGGRALVLDEEHESAGLGAKRLLEVRVGIEQHRAAAVPAVADGDLAFEDVPDLGEVVSVPGMVR